MTSTGTTLLAETDNKKADHWAVLNYVTLIGRNFLELLLFFVSCFYKDQVLRYHFETLEIGFPLSIASGSSCVSFSVVSYATLMILHIGLPAVFILSQYYFILWIILLNLLWTFLFFRILFRLLKLPPRMCNVFLSPLVSRPCLTIQNTMGDIFYKRPDRPWGPPNLLYN